MRNFSASLGPHRYVRPISKLDYRACIRKTDLRGHATAYYDGGTLTPYRIEAVVELVSAESTVDCASLELTLELEGDCGDMLLDDIAARFACLESPGVRVRICAFGHMTRVPVSNPASVVTGH